MLKIAESEDLRKQMHQASIKKANRFSVDKIMNEWEKLFK